LNFLGYLRKILMILNQKSLTGKFLRLILFLLLYMLSRSIDTILYSNHTAIYILGPVHNFITFIIIHFTRLICSIFYDNVIIENYNILVVNDKPTITLGTGCTGLVPMARLCFILSIYPLKLSKKVYLFPISILVLLFASMVHFLLLTIVAVSYPPAFELFHDIITKLTFYGFFFLCWIIWEKFN
jgi:exosortase/archaeosortase family protein